MNNPSLKNKFWLSIKIREAVLRQKMQKFTSSINFLIQEERLIKSVL